MAMLSLLAPLLFVIVQLQGASATSHRHHREVRSVRVLRSQSPSEQTDAPSDVASLSEDNHDESTLAGQADDDQNVPSAESVVSAAEQGSADNEDASEVSAVSSTADPEARPERASEGSSEAATTDASSAEAVVAAAEQLAAQEPAPASIAESSADAAQAAMDKVTQTWQRKQPRVLLEAKQVQKTRNSNDHEDDDDDDDDDSDDKEDSDEEEENSSKEDDKGEAKGKSGHEKQAAARHSEDKTDAEGQVLESVSLVGKVALARNKLQANRKKRAELTQMADELENTDTFQYKVDSRVKEIVNETQAPALGSFLGDMWKDIRRFASPFYVEHLEEEEKKLEKQEPALEEDLKKAESDLATARSSNKRQKPPSERGGSVAKHSVPCFFTVLMGAAALRIDM